MAHTPGTRLGANEFTAQIGEGGGRDVALKLLPDAFASEPDRLARFTREAQALASLSHQHSRTLTVLKNPVVRWRSTEPSGMPSFALRTSARLAAVQRLRVRKEYNEP